VTNNAEGKHAIGNAARLWWRTLQPPPDHQTKGGNSGALARLRRSDLGTAAIEEVTSDLHRRLAPLTWLSGTPLLERTALIAALLAHVREDDKRKVAAALGKQEDDSYLLHPLRLRRLFATHKPAACLIAFRRAIAMLGNKTNVGDLAESLFDWPDAHRGETRRISWAFDYYGGGSAAPDAVQDTSRDTPAASPDQSAA